MFKVVYSIVSGIIIQWSAAPGVAKEDYRWRNIVIQDPPGMIDRSYKEVAVPYIDPIPGGWLYEVSDTSEWYWDDNNCVNCLDKHKVANHWNLNKFTFNDVPIDTRLKPGETIEFNTCLVHVPTNIEVKCFDWFLDHKQRVHPRIK